MTTKKSLENRIRGWFPQEPYKINAITIPKNKNSLEQKSLNNQASRSLLVGSSFAFSSFFIFTMWLDDYRSLWFLMAGGAVIGLIIGSIVGIESFRVSKRLTNQEKPRPWLGLILVATFLIVDLFTALSSYLLWQEHLIQPELFLPLINYSVGFMTSFFIADGLIRRHIQSSQTKLIPELKT